MSNYALSTVKRNARPCLEHEVVIDASVCRVEIITLQKGNENLIDYLKNKNGIAMLIMDYIQVELV